MSVPLDATVLIVRPPGDAAKRLSLNAAIEAQRRAGRVLDVRTTEHAGDALRMASDAAVAGAALVIAAGGDGTVNEVVNGLLRVENPPRFAVLPMGTANDFAATLDLPTEPATALEVALAGVAELLDVARVNDRYFINVSTGGFGADATKSAPRRAKRLFGPLAYAAAGLKRLVALRPYGGEFVCDGDAVHRGGFMFYAVGNARRTGGGARVTPRADLDDRRLDAMVMRAVSRLELLALLPDLRAGTHLEHPAVLYLRARTLEFRPDMPTPVNADGEAVEGMSYRYDVSGRQLRVMLPIGHAEL